MSTPAPDETDLSAEDLQKALGGDAAVWPSLGLRVTRAADDSVRVWWETELVGHVRRSQEFPHLPAYEVVVSTAEGGPTVIGMPHGYIPQDPLYARHSERLRWLPEDHPDHTQIPLPEHGPALTGPRDTGFWAAHLHRT